MKPDAARYLRIGLTVFLVLIFVLLLIEDGIANVYSNFIEGMGPISFCVVLVWRVGLVIKWFIKWFQIFWAFITIRLKYLLWIGVFFIIASGMLCSFLHEGWLWRPAAMDEDRIYGAYVDICTTVMRPLVANATDETTTFYHMTEMLTEILPFSSRRENPEVWREAIPVLIAAILFHLGLLLLFVVGIVWLVIKFRKHKESADKFDAEIAALEEKEREVEEKEREEWKENHPSFEEWVEGEQKNPPN